MNDRFLFGERGKSGKKQSEKEQFQERKQDRACESIHVDQPQKFYSKKDYRLVLSRYFLY